MLRFHVSKHQPIITVDWMNILHQEIDTDKLMEPVVLPDMGIWHPFLGAETVAGLIDSQHYKETCIQQCQQGVKLDEPE